MKKTFFFLHLKRLVKLNFFLNLISKKKYNYVLSILLIISLLISFIAPSSSLATLQGDVDGNCFTNIMDLIPIAKNIGLCAGDEDFNFLYDLNKDRMINILDLIICAREIGNTCENTLPPIPPIITRPVVTETLCTNESRILIAGFCDYGVKLILVNDSVENVTFIPNDTEWSFLANIMEGENIFSIVAEDHAGRRSSPTIITISKDDTPAPSQPYTIDAAWDETTNLTQINWSWWSDYQYSDGDTINIYRHYDVINTETIYQSQMIASGIDPNLDVYDYWVPLFTEGDFYYAIRTSNYCGKESEIKCTYSSIVEDNFPLVSIDAGAGCYNIERPVSLTIYAPGCDAIAISEDSASLNEYRNFTEDIMYHISSTSDGIKTIYVKCSYPDGTEKTISDNINAIVLPDKPVVTGATSGAGTLMRLYEMYTMDITDLGNGINIGWEFTLAPPVSNFPSKRSGGYNIYRQKSGSGDYKLIKTVWLDPKWLAQYWWQLGYYTDKDLLALWAARECGTLVNGKPNPWHSDSSRLVAQDSYHLVWRDPEGEASDKYRICSRLVPPLIGIEEGETVRAEEMSDAEAKNYGFKDRVVMDGAKEINGEYWLLTYSSLFQEKDRGRYGGNGNLPHKYYSQNNKDFLNAYSAYSGSGDLLSPYHHFLNNEIIIKIDGKASLDRDPYLEPGATGTCSLCHVPHRARFDTERMLYDIRDGSWTKGDSFDEAPRGMEILYWATDAKFTLGVTSLRFLLPYQQNFNSYDNYDITGMNRVTYNLYYPEDHPDFSIKYRVAVGRNIENSGHYPSVIREEGKKPGISTQGDVVAFYHCLGPESETIRVDNVFKVENIQLQDSDGRRANNNLLEIVPPFEGEKIKGQAIIKPIGGVWPPDFPEWVLNGKDPKYGEFVEYEIDSIILGDGTPLLSVGTRKACVIDSEGYRMDINAYPFGRSTYTFEFGKWVKGIDDALKVIGFFNPGEAKWTLPKIENCQIPFENWWAEHPDNNLVWFCFQTSITFDPFLEFSQEFPLLGGALPWLSQYGKIGLFFTAGGKLVLDAGSLRREPKKSVINGGLTGEITIGLKGVILAADIVKVEIEGKSGISANAEYFIDNGLKIEPKIDVGGLTITGSVLAWNGWIELDKKEELWKPYTLWPRQKVVWTLINW